MSCSFKRELKSRAVHLKLKEGSNRLFLKPSFASSRCSSFSQFTLATVNLVMNLFGNKILVILLSSVKGCSFFHTRIEFILGFCLDFLQVFLGNFLLFLVDIPNSRSTLTLSFIQRSMHTPPVRQHLLVGYLGWVKLDQESLGMIENRPVGWVGLLPSRVSNDGPHNSGHTTVKAELRSPKSSQSTNKEIVSRRFRLVGEGWAFFVVLRHVLLFCFPFL